MLGVAMYTTIKTLWEIGKNKTEIARLTGHDWKTVAKVIKNMEKGIEKPKYKDRDSIIESYREEVIKLLERGLTGVRIHEELKHKGFEGSYSTVRRYLQNMRKITDIFVRVNTLAGEEAQVDFGYAGITRDDAGKNRKTWVFNMRLSYSRYDFYCKVYDQRVETFIRCHIDAFEFFGGVPEVVKIDNLKAAILKANFYEPVYQDLYRRFAAYYSFKPVPCRIYHANDKGKVESGIGYVKGNFFKGRKFDCGKVLDKELSRWNEKANSRIHGTTRKVPSHVFEAEEIEKLGPLPDERFKMPRAGTRRVYHDCHIYVDYNYYSVPYEYVGKDVEINLTDDFLKVSYDNEDIAIHKRIADRGNFSTVDAHYPKYKKIDETEYRQVYRAKMAAIGDYGQRLFDLIVKNNKSYWAQPVKGILSLREKYPDNVLEASCKRAYYYGVVSYQMVKNICQSGAYNLPLEEVGHEYAKVQA